MTLETLVDFHCHLDLYKNYTQAIAETEEAGIYTVGVTTTPRAWPHNRDLTDGMRYVRPALGLHPQLVDVHVANDLALWDRFLPEARYIGEVGLDAGPDFVHTLAEQVRVFSHILTSCADVGGKILSVHAVRSVDTVLDLVEELLPSDRGRVVLHWFTGTPAQSKRAAGLGCYFSINEPMLKSGRGRALIQELPPGRLLTETDGPFTRRENRPSMPADVGESLDLLSRMMGITREVASAKVAANLRTLLSSSDA
jgi:TatD DNase family protein